MFGVRLGVEPPSHPAAAPADAPGPLDNLGHFLLESVTARRAGVATIVLIGAFAVMRWFQRGTWPTQAEVIKFALAVLGLPTATSIFAALVLLPPTIPGASEDSLVAAGIVGTVVVLIESLSTIWELLKKK